MIALIILIGCSALSFGAACLLEHIFDDASFDDAACGLTGATAARQLLGAHLATIEVVEQTDELWLSDHFDRRDKQIVLSGRVGPERSVAAIAVAAHEAAHALHCVERARIFRVQTWVGPASAGASLAYMVLPLLALLLVPIGLGVLIVLAAIASLFTLLVVELIRLPEEIGASVRALRIATAAGLLTADERRVARRVLTAAAFTYVVAALNIAVALVWMAGSDDD